MAMEIDCDSIWILTSFTRYMSEGYSPGEERRLQKASSWEVFMKASAFLFVLKTLLERNHVSISTMVIVA